MLNCLDTTEKSDKLAKNAVENLVKMANFVDLDATPAEMDGLEVSEPQAGGDGGAERDLRRLDWGRERNFQSAGDLGGLDGNLPDVNEIVHSEDFSCERKGVGVEGNENEGHGTSAILDRGS